VRRATARFAENPGRAQGVACIESANQVPKRDLNRDQANFAGKGPYMRAAAVKTKIEPSFEAAPKATPEASVAVQVVEGGFEPVSSPARALQARLESGYAEERGIEGTAQDGRWPLYLALPFWVVLSSLMWTGVVTGAWALIHHI
jgi:hypothetical protein